jgi:hypothetical protein
MVIAIRRLVYAYAGSGSTLYGKSPAFGLYSWGIPLGQNWIDFRLSPIKDKIGKGDYH